MSKPKRLFVYQCVGPKRDGKDCCGDYFVPNWEIYFEGLKGPQFESIQPFCPNEPCLGSGKFVGVYVPEGTPPPHPAKSGKRKKGK